MVLLLREARGNGVNGRGERLGADEGVDEVDVWGPLGVGLVVEGAEAVEARPEVGWGDEGEGCVMGREGELG